MAERPSFVSKSATTALMSSFDPGFVFAAAKAELLANASLSAPHKPLGSAAETAIPANIVLSKILVHSSGLKLCLFAIPTSYLSQSHFNNQLQWLLTASRSALGSWA